MMGKSLLRHAISLGILLTLSQINSVTAAPLADTNTDEWEYYYDCPETTTSTSSTFKITSTVLEASDGQIYVPYTTFASTVPYTTNGVTSYSTTFVTEYSSHSSSSTKAAAAHTSSTLVGPVTPVLSTNSADSSSYTRSLSSGLTSLTSSAVQTASTTVKAQTSGVRRLSFCSSQLNQTGLATRPPVEMVSPELPIS